MTALRRTLFTAAALLIYRARLPLAVFAVEFGVGAAEWLEHRRARSNG